MLIPKDVALKRVCVAVGLEKNLLTVAMSDPLLFSLVQDLEFQTGYRIKQVVSTRGDINDAIQTCYPDKALMRTTPASRNELAVSVPMPARSRRGDVEGPTAETALARRVEEEVFEPVVGLKERSEAAPIIDLVDLVVKSAIKSKASDIHVEPMEKGVLIRHRLDGLLKEVMDLPKWVHEGLIARLKIMAGMDIAEKRLPQDGRLRASAEDGTEVDFRVSTLRTLFGEKVVMRVLDHRKGVPALEEIGMSAAALEEVREFLRHQHGMILVVGPTGSGKTTTLSSALRSVQSEKTNIITIEDPIEYQIPGVNQTQINEKIKLTFASALRSILRQDPDVILLGEIRDAETAKIAMQAAQTGHLVMSTLHTDNAPSVVTRLMDIGAEPYVIASALVGVVAQRLVRRLCVHCRRQYTPAADVLRSLNISETDAAAIPFYKSTGCDQCNHTGYRGRIGIYEVMRVTDKLRRLISARVDRRPAPRGGRERRHDHVGRGRPLESEKRRHDTRGAAARGDRSARDAHVVHAVRRRRRRRLQRLSAVRQACRQRLPALRPRHAARLEFLSVLRAQHERSAQARAEAAARQGQRGPRPARAAAGERGGVQEVVGVQKLLRAPRDRHHGAFRRGEASVPAADRPLSP